MSPTSGRGNPESNWLVTRRCLAILLQLQQGPAQRDQLIQSVYQWVGNDAYGLATGSPLIKRFRGDLDRLDKQLGVKVRYQSKAIGYKIVKRDRPLLSLPSPHLETLSFLTHTFKSNTPGSFETHQLLDQLVEWLPQEQQRQYQALLRQRTLQLDFSLRDEEQIDPLTEQIVRDAWEQRRYLSFDYESRSNRDGIPRHHVVQPWELRVNRRKHLELWAYCEWQSTAVSPNGWEYRNYRTYRLSRMISGSVEMLPKKLPGVRPIGRPLEAVYELHPDLVRFGLSTQDELISEPVIIELDDGWWRVEGKTYSAFSLARELLYYGGRCRVIGGKELLGEIKKVLKQLTEIYDF